MALMKFDKKNKFTEKESIVIYFFLKYDNKPSYPKQISENENISEVWCRVVCNGLYERGILRRKVFTIPRRGATYHYFLKYEVDTLKSIFYGTGMRDDVYRWGICFNSKFYKDLIPELINYCNQRRYNEGLPPLNKREEKLLRLGLGNGSVSTVDLILNPNIRYSRLVELHSRFHKLAMKVIPKEVADALLDGKLFQIQWLAYSNVLDKMLDPTRVGSMFSVFKDAIYRDVASDVIQEDDKILEEIIKLAEVGENVRKSGIDAIKAVARWSEDNPEEMEKILKSLNMKIDEK